MLLQVCSCIATIRSGCNTLPRCDAVRRTPSKPHETPHQPTEASVQVAWLRTPQIAMSGAAIVNLLSAAVAATTSETLPASSTRQVQWRQLVAGPFEALKYFWRSPEIGSFHVQRTMFLSVMIGAMSVNGLYRRQVINICVHVVRVRGSVSQSERQRDTE